MPHLPSDLSYLIEFIDRMVVPLTMVCFVFCWFWVLDDPEKQVVTENKEARQKAYRATARGLGAGMGLAILLLFFLYSFVLRDEATPPQNVLQITSCAAVWSSLAGLVIGIGMRVLATLKVKEFLAISPFIWGCLVTVGTALGWASLVIYYAGTGPNSPHAWLVWGYASLLFSYRVAFLLGD